MGKKATKRDYAVLELSEECWREWERLADMLGKGTLQTMEEVMERHAEMVLKKRREVTGCD